MSARISPAIWSAGGGPATSMLAQADGLVLVCALALDSAAYDGPDDNGEVLGEVAKMCSRLLAEARRAIRVADDLLAEL